MNAGPDFLVIGAMKCATSTLHVQLSRQPGFFMSEPKEPCFFSDDDVWAKGIDWYRGLFDGAGDGDICGESSTHYTKLPTHPSTIDRALDTLGNDLRVIYVMREPVSRLVSHYVHEWTQRVIDVSIDEAVVRHTELVAYSRYAMQLEPWIERLGAERVMPVFFDGLTTHPQRTLERVCRFLGADGTPVWHDEAAQQNVSSKRMRKSAWRDTLMNLPGAATLRRTLLPEGVRDRIKQRWTMQDRPELSADTRREIEAIFDEDLARLGRWLGVALDCATFREATRDLEPEWADAPSPAPQREVVR